MFFLSETYSFLIFGYIDFKSNLKSFKYDVSTIELIFTVFFFEPHDSVNYWLIFNFFVVPNNGEEAIF